MHLGLPDATGRQTPEEIAEAATSRSQADLVIKALGFDPEDLPALFGEPELAVTRWGTLKIDHRTMMTSLDGVFAAGDIVRGASLVVWAIRDGRDAAAQIARAGSAGSERRASPSPRSERPMTDETDPSSAASSTGRQRRAVCAHDLRSGGGA